MRFACCLPISFFVFLYWFSEADIHFLKNSFDQTPSISRKSLMPDEEQQEEKCSAVSGDPAFFL